LHDAGTNTLFRSTFDTPVGPLTVVCSQSGVREVRFGKPDARLLAAAEPSEKMTVGIRRQLKEYFAGKLSEFTVPLDPVGTPFQKKVWKELSAIPFASTISYKDLAARVGNPRACRAVGGANGSNPLPIVVPCHRVIAADGSMGGYSGCAGLVTKRYLLELEKKHDLRRAREVKPQVSNPQLDAATVA
jgi:methylated-DNA-[protein]-cysteine S-methyltransferase